MIKDQISSFFETNLDFLFPHTKQIDFNIILPFLVLKTLEFLFPVSLLQLTLKVFMFIFYNHGCLKNNQQEINHQLKFHPPNFTILTLLSKSSIILFFSNGSPNFIPDS